MTAPESLEWQEITYDPPPTVGWQTSPGQAVYHIYQMDPSTFHVDQLDADFPTLDEAKAAVEADYAVSLESPP